MKPVQIVLLVAVGAIGGALIMKTMAVRNTETAAIQQPQAAAPAVQPVQAPPAVVPEPEKPSPVEPARPPRAVRRQPPVVKKPVTSARVDPPSPISSEPVKAAPAPEPVAPAPAPRVDPEPVAPPPPEPHRVTLSAGTLLPVRLIDGLSTERNQPGDTFTGTLDRPLVVDGFAIAERGSRVEGKVVTSDRGGKVKGLSAISVELSRLRTADGQNIAIQTDSFTRQAEPSKTQDAAKVGGGAALGAIIGAIAGGGKGAAIGAGAGGAAGAGGVLLTRGKAATLPSETRINFRLSAPVTVTEQR